jgi:hypothetical protein
LPSRHRLGTLAESPAARENGLTAYLKRQGIDQFMHATSRPILVNLLYVLRERLPKDQEGTMPAGRGDGRSGKGVGKWFAEKEVELKFIGTVQANTQEMVIPGRKGSAVSPPLA